MMGEKSFAAGKKSLSSGNAESAMSYFEKVRPIYEKDARDHPDDARFHAPLGLLYAYLGRKDDAIRESLRAVELVPESKTHREERSMRITWRWYTRGLGRSIRPSH